MSKFELRLPQMGESVAEATLTTWLKNVGDTVELDEPVFEIATDKVDSEVPSEVEGKLVRKLFQVDEVVKVGEVVALIEIDGDDDSQSYGETTSVSENIEEELPQAAEEVAVGIEEEIAKVATAIGTDNHTITSNDSPRFYSPLVRNIAKQEGISVQELDGIVGTGSSGRVTKYDILTYIERGGKPQPKEVPDTPPVATPTTTVKETTSIDKPLFEPEVATNSAVFNENTLIKPSTVAVSQEDEVIPLTRMGKLIAHHMMESLNTSAHVQSFIEVDVTNVVNWRNKVKKEFEAREGEKFTFTPIFMEAVAVALKKYPLVNISLEGDNVIKKKQINLGMAAALPDGNLIVPVIKNADQLNLVGMAKMVNDLANRARNNQLKPDEIKGGTYTVTNVGSFGSVFGTPIINQPQVGILALGAIRKVPAVIETADGDFIGIRHHMFLSHSYDHRVVNGALGGMFVKAVADYLEAWDINRAI